MDYLLEDKYLATLQDLALAAKRNPELWEDIINRSVVVEKIKELIDKKYGA